MKIAADVFGGDNAPQAVMEGVVQALQREKDFSVLLFGDELKIAAELKKYEYDKARVEIVHAPDVIGYDEAPTVAVKRKKDSSLVKALEALCDKSADAFVSAGSTGAVLAGATLIVRRLKGVKRPALAPLLPTRQGSHILLIDCGANVDSKPSYLQQFAVMADAYMREVGEVKAPRIGLINNGAEEEKGNELTKAAYQLLKKTPVQFAGNCEARDILSGEYDAVVCDGFVGNVVLKYTEGIASTLMGMIKDELMADTFSKLGAALSKNAFMRVKKKMDYTEYGGAPLLGIDGCVIKAHGSSNGKAFAAAILQAKRFYEAGVNDAIARAIEALPSIED
ncbi:MAG TPA: phosphate acyltransferase PlsX [Clostridia bacterium]|nr:phosphate acyltransferase PlsX [Clostridia bacterium]